MYEIINNFIMNDLIGGYIPLGYILTDVSIILIYVALVYMLIWVFKIASSIIKF